MALYRIITYVLWLSTLIYVGAAKIPPRKGARRLALSVYLTVCINLIIYELITIPSH